MYRIVLFCLVLPRGNKHNCTILKKVSLIGLLSGSLTIIPLITQAAIYYVEDEDDLYFPGFSNIDVSKTYDDSPFLKLESGKYRDQFINALLAFKENRFDAKLEIPVISKA